MFFRKKPNTIETLIESLTEKCEKDFTNFLWNIKKFQYKAYYEFKCQLKEDFLDLMTEISECEDDEVTLKLLQYFKIQLDFINNNVAHADNKDLAQFYKTYYPYKEKMDEVIKGNIVFKVDISTSKEVTEGIAKNIEV